MKNRLKPCPYCLSKKIGVRCRSDNVTYQDGTKMGVRRVRYYVRCNACRARGPEIHGLCPPVNATLAEIVNMQSGMMIAEDVKIEAIKRWNERAELFHD